MEIQPPKNCTDSVFAPVCVTSWSVYRCKVQPKSSFYHFRLLWSPQEGGGSAHIRAKAMSSSLTCTKLTLFTIAALLTQIIGLSLFVLGFFPVKPALSGVRYSFHSFITLLRVWISVLFWFQFYLLSLLNDHLVVQRVSIRLVNRLRIRMWQICLLISSSLYTRFVLSFFGGIFLNIHLFLAIAIMLNVGVVCFSSH